jgi:hypothetical protein
MPEKNTKFLIISATVAGERRIQAGYPANIIVTTVSGCCLFSFPSSFLPSFLYFFISPFLSIVLASAIGLLFLPFILLSSLPFLHKKKC